MDFLRVEMKVPFNKGTDMEIKSLLHLAFLNRFSLADTGMKLKL